LPLSGGGGAAAAAAVDTIDVIFEEGVLLANAVVLVEEILLDNAVVVEEILLDNNAVVFGGGLGDIVGGSGRGRGSRSLKRCYFDIVIKCNNTLFHEGVYLGGTRQKYIEAL
jgi:hypothetical protein